MIYVCHCYSHIFLSLLCAHTNGWANIDTHTCILRIRWNMYNVEKIICWKAGFEPWGCHDFYHLRWFNCIKVWSRGKWLDRISGFWPQVMQFRGFQWCSIFSKPKCWMVAFSLATLVSTTSTAVSRTGSSWTTATCMSWTCGVRWI